MSVLTETQVQTYKDWVDEAESVLEDNPDEYHEEVNGVYTRLRAYVGGPTDSGLGKAVADDISEHLLDGDFDGAKNALEKWGGIDNGGSSNDN